MAGTLEPHFIDLEHSLRESLQQQNSEPVRRQDTIELQRDTWRRNRQAPTPGSSFSSGVLPSDATKMRKEEESIVAAAHAKEEAIEKRKTLMKEKLQLQLNRVTHEAQKLDELRREVESLEDPTKKEVADIRKKIESVEKELKPLQQLCTRKEKELKEAVEARNEKAKIKTDLVVTLMEIVTTSENVRMQKLDELNKHLEAMNRQGITS